ncbi:hypothetical protein AB5I41_18335 [Sphingomonas sp. MMS24-JH45]
MRRPPRAAVDRRAGERCDRAAACCVDGDRRRPVRLGPCDPARAAHARLDPRSRWGRDG